MTSDYTKEVGLPSNKKTLPRPVAIAILAIVGAGVSFGVVNVVAKAREHEAASKPAQPPPATAPASAPAAAPVAPADK